MEEWKKFAIRKLNEYNAMNAALTNLEEEIECVESEMVSIRSAVKEGTPVQGGGSTREDRLLFAIAYRDELKRCLKRTKARVEEVDRAMATLSPEYQKILYHAYIAKERGYAARLVEEREYAEESSVYRAGTRAIRAFTKAMYGVEE